MQGVRQFGRNEDAVRLMRKHRFEYQVQSVQHGGARHSVWTELRRDMDKNTQGVVRCFVVLVAKCLMVNSVAQVAPGIIGYGDPMTAALKDARDFIDGGRGFVRGGTSGR